MGLIDSITNTVSIVNETQLPLDICLAHVSPLHYVNNVQPGQKAEFVVPPIWYTVQAKVHTGEAEEYNRYQTYAAPVAITLTALSLGAGAIYIAGAASAAGGVGAAAAQISARVGAAAAAKGPTARRLYKLARRGQTIVSMGNVLGIGGGALLGAKAAQQTTQQQEEEEAALLESTGKTPKHSELVAKDAQGEAATKSSWFPAWTEQRRVKEAKRVLKGLLSGTVVSSPGWRMSKRTIRIRGGPRATEIEGLLVIETDTMTPFEVVGDAKDPEDGKIESGPGESEESKSIFVKWFGKSKEVTAKDTKDSLDEKAAQITVADAVEGKIETVDEKDKETSTVPAVTTASAPASTAPSTAVSNVAQKNDHHGSKDTSKSLFERMRIARVERQKRAEELSGRPVGAASASQAADAESSDDESLLASAPNDLDRQAASSPMPPPDDDPAAPPSIRSVLLSMGFKDEQVDEVLRAGELPTDDKLASMDPQLSEIEKDERMKAEREAQIEKALLYLFEHADRQQTPFAQGEKEKAEKLASATATSSGVATPISGAATPSSEAAPASKVATKDPAKPALKVANPEAVTKPSIIMRAKTAADDAGATKAFNAASSLLVGQGTKWLQGEDKKSKK